MTGRTLAAIGFLALMVRLTNLAFFPIDFQHLVFHDAEMFWHGSEAMVRLGGYFTQGDVPQVERVPLYFILLAGIRLIFGGSLLAPLMINCLIDAASCMVIAALGARLGPRIGWVSGLVAAVWLNFIIHTTYILSETLFLFVFSCVLLAAARFLEMATIGRAACLGLLLGLATMVRTVTEFLIIILPVVVFIAATLQRNWRRGVAAAMAALLLALAPLAPLLLRNRIEYGYWQLAAQGGNHLLFWVVPSVKAAADGRMRTDIGTEMAARLNAELEAHPEIDRSSQFALDQVRTRLALAELREAPITAIARAWIDGMAQNLFSPALPLDPRIYLTPHPSLISMPGVGTVDRVIAYIKASPPVFVMALGLGLAGSIIASLLQLGGFIWLAGRKPWAAALAALCVAYFLLVSGPIGSAKYRIPFEPVLVVLTAVALCALRPRKEEQAPTP